MVRQRNRGKLTCRERIDVLLDRGSFREVGSLAGFATFDDDGDVAEFTPANHVGGQGRIDGRACIVCADDFTSRGGHADGAIGAEVALPRPAVDRAADARRSACSTARRAAAASPPWCPSRTPAAEASAKESTGAIKAGRPRVVGGGGSFLPGHLGSTDYTDQLATVPVVNMLLGSVVGIGAAKAVLGHFSVMVRDIAQLFVAGPPVVSHAMGYDITKEDLGGWHIHCRNGSVDNLAETEEEAMAHDAALPVATCRRASTRRRRSRPTDRSGRSPRGGAAHARAAQAHDDVRRAARDPADGRQGLASSRSGRCGAPTRSPASCASTAIRWA